MMNTPLDTSLDSYKKLVEDLESKLLIDTSRVLEILSARDALQIALKKQKPVSSAQLQQVIELDACIRSNASRIILEIDKDKGKEFIHWRKSVQPSDEAWWWQLDTIDSPPPKEKLEWLCRGLWIGTWAANISLAINIASRFGGAGSVGFFDPMGVIVPGIGALLAASGKLPKFEKLLKSLHIPEPNRERTKLWTTVVVSGILFGSSIAIPSVSKIYNSHGLEKYNSGDLSEAEKEYKRAISLDGHNTEAHYNLGNVYESLQDIDKAKKQYEIAIADKLPSAYNNLGRLYIQEKKYPQAVALLFKGLVQADRKKSNPEINYSLFKNLGWARLKQSRYEEARQNLKAAIGIAESAETAKYIPNPGAAHCLMAQTLEQLKSKQPTALSEWIQCSKLGSKSDADEDTWLYLANQKLSKQKVPQAKSENIPKVK